MTPVEADSAASAELMDKYNITSIPTFILLDDSGEVVGKIIGAQSELTMRNWIKTVL